MMRRSAILDMSKPATELQKNLKKNLNHNLSGTAFLINSAFELKHRPNIVEGFFSGVVSYPITWWAANIQLMCLSGWFGHEQESAARVRQAILDTLLDYALKNPLRTAEVVYYYIKDRVEYDAAHIAGRVLGGIITNNYLLKMRRIKKGMSRSQRGGISILMFSYVSYGAAIMAIGKGVRSVEQVLWSIITGESDLNKLISKKVFEHPPKIPDDDMNAYFNEIKPLLIKIRGVPYENSFSF